METTEKTDNSFKVIYDSIFDFVETTRADTDAVSRIIKYPTECMARNLHTSGYLVRNASWIGKYFSTWEDVYLALQSVNDTEMKRFERIYDQIKSEHVAPPESLKRQMTWSEDDGFDMDLDRLQRGAAFWRTTRRHHRPGPANVTIITAIGGHSGQESEDLCYRAAASVVLTELLESAGYRVDLWAVSFSGGVYGTQTPSNLIGAINLKRTSDMIDRVSLLNITCGWAFRTIWFRSFWHPPGSIVRSGYGSMRSARSCKDEITDDLHTFCVDDIWNHSTAVEWIRQQLKSLEENKL